MALGSVQSICNQEPGSSGAGGGPSATGGGTLGVGDGPDLGSAWGLWKRAEESGDSSGPTAAPGGRRGRPATGGPSVLQRRAAQARPSGPGGAARDGAGLRS